MTQTRHLRLLAAFATAAMLSASPLQAQDLPETHLKIIGPHSQTLTWKASMQPFWDEELPELSEGRITADLVSMTELGLKGPEVFRLIKLGVADLGATGTGYASGEIPELDGFDLSGLVQDIDTLRKVVEAYAPVIDEIMRERAGVRMLAVWPTVQCAEPLSGLDDLQGKKVRVFATTQADFMKAVGASTITMPPSDVPTALQRGVMDCAITGTLSGNQAKWPEVTSHLYPINLGWSLWILTANEQSWSRLAPEVRDFIMDNLQNVMIKRAWELAETGSQQGVWCTVGDERCALGEEDGVTRYDMELVPYTEADDQRRKELVQKIALPEFAKRCGSECTERWNETVGEVLGMTAEAG
jgi:TRAP-type C4-dicarboxylate transport system substrate-binding protein